MFPQQSDCNKLKVVRRLLAFKNKSIYIHILKLYGHNSLNVTISCRIFFRFF